MNIITRFHHQFHMRIIFGGGLININGETRECDVHRVENKYHFTYGGKQICEPLWESYIEPVGEIVPAQMFQLCRVSESDGDATLILPLMWRRETNDTDDDEDNC